MVIPQVFKHVAVPLVRSALADDDHLAAHRHAIFRAEHIGHDFVFLDSVYTQGAPGDRIRSRAILIPNQRAIHTEGVRPRRHSIATEPRPGRTGAPAGRTGVNLNTRLYEGEI